MNLQIDPDAPDSIKLDEELATTFYEVVRLVFVIADNPLLQDLSILQSRLLRMIDAEPGRKVVDFAQDVGLSVSRVSRLLTSLVNLQLVDRVPDKADKRIVRMYVTDIAHDVLQQREIQRAARMNECLKHMSPDSALRLIESLHLLKRAAERSASQSKPTARP